MKRRHFLAALPAAAAVNQVRLDAAAAPAKSERAFELEELSLEVLGQGLAKGRWTSEKLARLYLARIEQIDKGGPHLNSVIEVNPEAMALARQLDQERKAGKVRGPMHGIPILLKDNIGTGDRMRTSAGSLALEGWRAPVDSFVAQKLRGAGALLLGKTNLSEWANFRSTHSTSGWSGRGGQTRNPYDLRRNPSGSSSGSAVAVAANLCAAAIGSETDGSIVSPSSINGVAGVKPTIGLVSRTGIIPISHSQDTAGPIARTVTDLAIILTALTGVDSQDPASALSESHAGQDYTKFLDANGLRGARLGVARKFFAKNAPLDRLLTGYVDVLKRSGAEVIDPVDLPSHGKWFEPENEVLLYEFKADLNAYLHQLPASAPVHSLADLIRFNQENRSREMPWFEQELFESAQEKGPLTEEKYLTARKDCVRLSRDEGIDAVLREHKLDAMVALTGGPAWLIDQVNGDADTGGCSTPAAVAGYPHITVPAGEYQGLPMSLSFFSTAWSEPVLFKLAYAFEAATHARRKPGYVDGHPV